MAVIMLTSLQYLFWQDSIHDNYSGIDMGPFQSQPIDLLNPTFIMNWSLLDYSNESVLCGGKHFYLVGVSLTSGLLYL